MNNSVDGKHQTTEFGLCRTVVRFTFFYSLLSCLGWHDDGKWVRHQPLLGIVICFCAPLALRIATYFLGVASLSCAVDVHSTLLAHSQGRGSRPFLGLLRCHPSLPPQPRSHSASGPEKLLPGLHFQLLKICKWSQTLEKMLSGVQFSMNEMLPVVPKKATNC